MNLSLNERLIRTPGQSFVPVGVSEQPFRYAVRFYLEHCTVDVVLLSPESRLSDHLNSSVPVVEVGPLKANQDGLQLDLSGTLGHLTKSRVLFVVPTGEPARTGSDGAAWKPTVQHSCSAIIGSYRLTGSIHTEAGKDPRIALRQMDEQFLPLTGVTITHPDGKVIDTPVVIINRHQLDLLAVTETNEAG